MKTYFSPVVILTLLAFAFSGCRKSGDESPSTESGKPVVFASIAPLAHLAERIGGDEIEVRALVDEADDPHDFSPTPKQLVALGNSDAFLVTGMPFEKTLVEKLQSGGNQLTVVDMTAGIELHEFDCQHPDHEHEEEHEGEEEGEHDHEHDHVHELDPHIWLSPPLLQIQAKSIVETLKKLSPDHAALFEERGQAIDTEIAALHSKLTETLAPMKDQKFYAYHGAFAYFADAYGMIQEAIETGGRQPEQKRIYSLIESAKGERVKTILVQPQFDPDSAETIAEAIGGKVVAIDPMASDVLENLDRLASAISEGR